MSELTPNYGFVKVVNETDPPDPELQNPNWDVLDTFPTTVNGVPADANGDIALTPEDIGIDLTPAGAGEKLAASELKDLGVMPYPTPPSESAGFVPTIDSSANTTWAAPSGGEAGSIQVDGLSEGLGLWGVPRKRQPKLKISSTATMFQAGHGWVASGPTGAAAADDTAIYAMGSQSLRVTAAKHASTLTYVTSPVLTTTLDLTTHVLEVVRKTALNSTISGMVIEVSSNSGTNWQPTGAAVTLGSTGDQFTFARVDADSFPVKTSVTFTAINRIRIGVRTPTATTTEESLWLQRIAVGLKTLTTPKLVVYTEATASLYTLRNKFLERGIPVTMSVRASHPADPITNDYMSAAQIREMCRLGWDWMPLQWDGTTVDTTNMSETDPVAYESALLKCLHWGRVNGLPAPQAWNMPNSANAGPPNASEIARRYFNYAIAGSINGDTNVPAAFPFASPHTIYSHQIFYSSGTTLTRAATCVQRVAASKGVGFYSFIRVRVGTSNSIYIGDADLTTMLDDIVTTGVECITTGEVADLW